METDPWSQMSPRGSMRSIISTDQPTKENLETSSCSAGNVEDGQLGGEALGHTRLLSGPVQLLSE